MSFGWLPLPELPTCCCVSPAVGCLLAAVRSSLCARHRLEPLISSTCVVNCVFSSCASGERRCWWPRPERHPHGAGAGPGLACSSLTSQERPRGILEAHIPCDTLDDICCRTVILHLSRVGAFAMASLARASMMATRAVRLAGAWHDPPAPSISLPWFHAARTSLNEHPPPPFACRPPSRSACSYCRCAQHGNWPHQVVGAAARVTRSADATQLRPATCVREPSW
jgi:hypothetical protein